MQENTFHVGQLVEYKGKGHRVYNSLNSMGSIRWFDEKDTSFMPTPKHIKLEEILNDITLVHSYAFEDLDIDACYRACSGTSFSPEVRAAQIMNDYDTYLNQAQEKIGDYFPTYRKKFKGLFTNWVHAKGSCLSTMITGPANFNTRRANTANNAEHNAYKIFQAYHDKCLEKAYKLLHPSTDVRLDDGEARAKLQDKLNKRIETQETYKEDNKNLRKTLKKHPLVDGLVTEEGVTYFTELSEGKRTEKYIKVFLTPDSYGGFGHASYSLSNNNAEIKRLQKRLIELDHVEKLAEKEDETFETTEGTIELERNSNDGRIRLHFEGKPEAKTRMLLNSNGFKWSRRNTAWQRMLNSNGERAARIIIQQLAI